MRDISGILGVNRGSFYYHPQEDPSEVVLQSEIEKLAGRYPRYGYRRITQLLQRQGYTVGTRRVARFITSASPMSFQTRCPSNCVWMKKRFRPEGRILTPKPLSVASRKSRVSIAGISVLILDSVSRSFAKLFSCNQLQTRTKLDANQAASAG